MTDWHLGTIGFGYKDWNGVFYPAGMASHNYLAHYSQAFDAVELDTTFYGTPSAAKVQRWAAAVPAGFKFCPKTPRHITHELRLQNAFGPMTDFVEAVRGFGDKLGAVLIQLPPDFAPDQAPVLAAFLDGLPKDVQYAVELRHRAWYDGPAAQLLGERDVCWASTDYPNLPRQVNVTADYIYIRWLGKHGQFMVKTHERRDMTARLQEWWAYIQARLGQIEMIYGFMNNDYAGYSPATCNKFKTIVGLPVTTPRIFKQQSLFDDL